MNAPPDLDDLPERCERTVVGGPKVQTFTLALRTVTAIIGGAPKTRTVDDIDYIRVPSIRGQLRFWWRALFGHRYFDDSGDGTDLFEAEGELWGNAGRDGQTRSPVELSVRVDTETVDDERSSFDYKRDGFYALWPAQPQKDGTKAAPRRLPGLEFDLRVRAPADGRLQEVKQTLRAWLLFGGYGSRTRRGLGTLTARENEADWLPEDCSIATLRELLGDDLFQTDTQASPPFPVLRGAQIFSSSYGTGGEDVWLKALQWLEDFRQGAPNRTGNSERHARQNSKNSFVGISNWPEPDKLRRLYDTHSKGHPPERHNETPVWPRAGFGLPIIGQFKDHGDPGDYEIGWFNNSGEYMSRMASPLIVKAMPLSDGRFAPIALWLDRSYPDGKVGIVNNKSPERGSRAAFDELVAKGDSAAFKPLSHGQDNPKDQRLREAFFWWLDEHNKASEVSS